VFSEPKNEGQQKLFVQTSGSTISCLFVLVVMLMMSVWVACWTILWTSTILVPLWSCHFKYYYLVDKKTLSQQPLLFQMISFYFKNKEPIFILTQRIFQNYLFINPMGIYRLVWPHYVINLCQEVFKYIWENLIKEMFMSPIVSINIYKSLTPYLTLTSNFPMAWSFFLALVPPLFLVMLD
jgi:hypothetical protein